MRRIRWTEFARLLKIAGIQEGEGGELTFWFNDGRAVVVADETGAGRMRATSYTVEEANEHLRGPG